MTKKTWVDLDDVTSTQLNRIEDQIVVICTSATRPTGVEGQVIYETDLDRLLVYNGSGWVILFTNWVSFTPTWTNLTVGDGTNSGVWRYDGTSILVRVHFTFGSTSAITGAPSFTLPNTETSRNDGIATMGICNLKDAALDAIGFAMCNPNTTEVGLFAVTNELSSTNPFTWATSDQIICTISVPV